AKCRLNIAARRSGVRIAYAAAAKLAPAQRAAGLGSSPINFSPLQAVAYSSHSRIASHYAGGSMSKPEAETNLEFHQRPHNLSPAVLD
ncbi:MAG: hypothetical protein WAN97_14910, partial [Candidatus Acidiferrales bacterium]